MNSFFSKNFSRFFLTKIFEKLFSFSQRFNITSFPQETISKTITDQMKSLKDPIQA